MLFHLIHQVISKSQNSERALEDAKWEELLEGRTVVVGDFNAYCQMWNPRTGGRRNAAVLETLIENFELYLTMIWRKPSDRRRLQEPP
jgi:hypothetical protein